jgi:catechol 2,3-dioxygenase-like lactoylglutathione lyase family enzyme
MVRAVGGVSITATSIAEQYGEVPQRDPDYEPRLDHVTLVASDFEASLAFYDAVFGALGLTRAAEFGDEEETDAEVEAAGWGGDDGRPLVWVVAGAVPTHGVHVSVRAPSRTAVEAFYAAAVLAGGAGRDAPRRWPIYRKGEFNAVVLDPDGNAIEALSAE